MADSTTTDAPVEDAQATSAEAPKPEAPKTDAPVEGEDALGDPGKKALDAMKAERNAAKAELTTMRQEAGRLKAAAEGREAEWETERKADADRESKFRNKYLSAEIKAAAKGALSDPEDAFKFLNLADFEVTDSGDVDSNAIAAAITNLITTKPYLAVQDGKRFQGTPDAGTRKESGLAQLTQADLANMSPEQVNQARRDGRLKNMLGGTS